MAGASKVPTKAFTWILEVEKKESTYESLEDSGPFESLDAKLSAAVIKTCGKGPLGRKLNLKAELEANQGRLVRGRQLLWMVYSRFKVSEEAGALYEYDINDLSAVSLKGDKNLEEFINNWDATLVGLTEAQPETNLEVLFLKQLRKCDCLKHDLAYYDRLHFRRATVTGRMTFSTTRLCAT